MARRGLRRILQPAFYLGIASLLHGLVLLIPIGSPHPREFSGTTRGIKVRTFQEAPPAAGRQTRSVPPPPAVAPAQPVPPPPSSMSSGGGTPGIGRETTAGAPKFPSPVGEGGDSTRKVEGRRGIPEETEYGAYLARLRSEEVQGWAKEQAQESRHGYKGTGKEGLGWIGGSSSGTRGKSGTGGGTGTDEGRGGSGRGYLDPRVQMVVTIYPVDENGRIIESRVANIESRFPQVRYPERKFKKHEYTEGWWNVYLQIQTDKSGKVTQSAVLRPTTIGPMEKVFVDQVRKETSRWSFDPVAAEINIDVRFYVE